jgi:hypothetical protein
MRHPPAPGAGSAAPGDTATASPPAPTAPTAPHGTASAARGRLPRTRRPCRSSSSVISGIAQGCIYGLIALGFVLIYKATETVSFAQGDLMMLGAFCGLAHDDACWASRSGWRCPARSLAMALFGLLAERLGDPAHPRPAGLQRS